MEKGSSQNKKLLSLIQKLKQAREEGKSLYLDSDQFEDIIEHYIANKELHKALEVTESALKIHPESAELTAALMALYIDSNRIEEARQAYENLKEKESFAIKLMNVELLIAEGEPTKARRVIETFPPLDIDVTDCISIGYICNESGFWDESSYWFKRALKHSPENEEAMLGLAEFYQYTDNYEKAIPLYNKLIDKDPYASTYWTGLAKAHFYTEDMEKTIEAADFALVSNSEDGEAHAIKGHAYYQLNNIEEAVKSYKRAWELNSGDQFVPALMTFGLISLERWSEAFEFLMDLPQNTNNEISLFSELLASMTRSMMKTNKYDEALTMLKRGEQLYPNNPSLQICLGQCYFYRGEATLAKEYFAKAIEMEETAEAWFNIGEIASETRDYEFAKEAFRKALELDPNLEEAHKNLQSLMGRSILGDDDPRMTRKMFKERLRQLAEFTGERPKLFDMDSNVREARENGKSQEEIDEIVRTINIFNEAVKNFDIDEEGDDTTLIITE